MQRIVPLLGSILLAACAAPGKEDLVAQGIQDEISLSGDHEKLADCIVKRFDNEPWSLMELQTPVTRVRRVDGTTIELVAGSPASAQIFLWTAVLQQRSASDVLVEIVARRDVNPYLSSRYMIEKVRRNVESCRIE